MVGPVLTAEGLRRSYGGRTVLDVDALEVQPGEVLAVIGPNGAGKSTLFRLLLLLEQPDGGVIRLDGEPVRPGDRGARGRLTGVFQRAVLFSGTVRDNVGFGLRARGVGRSARAARVDEALGWLDLGPYADAPVHTLSGGEAQRVALARALITQPDVLLLDEPTSSLDISMRRRFRADLERVARQHARAIVLVTHDTAEAFGVADRVVVLEGGRVIQAGAPDEIMMRPASPFIAELTGAELLVHGRVTDVAEGLVEVTAGDRTRLWATPSAAAIGIGASVVVGYRPEDIVIAPSMTTAPTSAMNRVEGTVRDVAGSRGLTRVRLDCGDVVLTALVTGHSVAALGLVAGQRASAQIKATALHAWQRETREP